VQSTQLVPSHPVVYPVEIVDDLPALAQVPPGLPFWERRTFVWGTLAFTGPPGLFFLWLSRRFANRTKIAISLGYFALTVGLPVAMIWYWCDHAIRPLVDTLGK
jgi:hypothetical protein